MNEDQLPDSIRNALSLLRKKSKHYVQVRYIHNGFYAYEVATHVDAKTQKKKRVSFYLGRILDDGKLIMPRRRQGSAAANSIGEQLSRMDSRNDASPFENAAHPNEIDLRILTAISTDGRMPISEIGAAAGIGRTSAQYRLEKLEKEYGIRYTLEFGPRPFGLFRYFILVRFIHGKPSADKIRDLLKDNYMIQLVALTKGESDMFIYVLAEDTKKLEDMIYEIRSSHVFAGYGAEWMISYITYSYGYLPIREEFFDYLNGRIWHRTKETPRKKERQLLEREYIVLKELNAKGNLEFEQIEKKHGLSHGSASYTYYKLLEQSVIKRATITMETPPIKYNAIVLLKQFYINYFNATRDRFLMHIISDTQTPINKYLLIGDIGAPYGFLFISPIFNDGELNSVEAELKSLTGKSEISSLIITDILLGSLGYRRLDNKESLQYKALSKPS